MGSLKKLVAFVVVIGLAIAGWTLLQPEIIAYQVKGAARIACNEMMREKRYSTLGTSQSKWEDKFKSLAGQAGVSIKREHYEFEVEGETRGDLYCRASIRFPIKVEWFIISDYLDLPPYETIGKVDVQQKGAKGF